MEEVALFFAQRVCTGKNDYVDPPVLKDRLHEARKLLHSYSDIDELIAAYLPLLLLDLYGALLNDFARAKYKQSAWHKAVVVDVDDDADSLKLVTFQLADVEDESRFNNVAGDIICIADESINASIFSAGRIHIASSDKRHWIAYLPSEAARRVQKGKEFKVWRFSR